MKNRLITLVFASAFSLGLINGAHAAQGSGCMPTTGTVSGLTFAQKVNDAFAALISGNSGASAPSTDCSAAPVKGQIWLDTSVTPNVERRYDGTNWVAVGAIDSVNHVWAPPVGGGTAAVIAATTTDICASPSALQTITGTTPIASFGSGCPVGVRKTLIFASATPITYNATSMILPALRDYVAAAGDMAEALHLGSGNWRVRIDRIDGSAVTNPSVPLGTVLFGDYGTPPVKTVYGAGQAISRTTYADYFLAMTRAQTASLTTGSATITSVSNTAGLGAGMPIEGTGVQAGTVISSVTSSTITMSKTATETGSRTVRVIIPGYGNGGDTNTIGVKDCQGRVMAGRDGTIGAVLGRLDNATVINSFQGNKAAQLNTNNLPPYTPSGSISSVFNSAQQFYAGTGIGAPGNGGFPVGNAPNNPFLVQPDTWGLASAFTGNPQGGTSAPFYIVQPTSIAECVVAVLP